MSAFNYKYPVFERILNDLKSEQIIVPKNTALKTGEQPKTGNFKKPNSKKRKKKILPSVTYVNLIGLENLRLTTLNTNSDDKLYMESRTANQLDKFKKNV